MKSLFQIAKGSFVGLCIFLVWGVTSAGAVVLGVTGPTFNLIADDGYITTGEGNSVFMWGFAESGSSDMQYPGPTLIVNEGDNVVVNLTNALPVNTSITFPGHDVTATGGIAGVVTSEAAASGGTVQYSFDATNPGTYTYYSATDTGLQSEMGLFGTLIVQPTNADGRPLAMFGLTRAYGHANTTFDYEYLYVLSEIDDNIHNLVETGQMELVDMAKRAPTYWLINGRTGPDTLFPSGAPYLPTQPYGSFAQTRPGETVLVRIVSAGVDAHPFHTHGQNLRVIARDGRMRSSGVGAGADVGLSDFTLTSSPGQTYDALWNWKGENLGWDIYGHTSVNDPLEMGEDPADHGKPIPVDIPENQFLAFGGFWSGSPFLGRDGLLPPGEGGLNPTGGFYYMWHSHNERELVNFDVAPGGMMTMMAVEPPGTPIP